MVSTHRQETMFVFRRNGYSTDLLFDFSIATDIKNSSYRTIYFDQALLGMSREYIVKGLDDEDVGHYYDFMQKVIAKSFHIATTPFNQDLTQVAILLGADPDRAKEELRESLQFEIRLAEISIPREKRRDATKFYHPVELGNMSEIAPFISDWTEYSNRLLTAAAQVVAA